jgi:hypothetical protein
MILSLIATYKPAQFLLLTKLRKDIKKKREIIFGFLMLVQRLLSIMMMTTMPATSMIIIAIPKPAT